MIVLRSTEDHNLSLVNVYNDKSMFGIEDHNLSLVRVHCHNLFLVLNIVTLVLLRFNVISLCLRSRIITLVFFRFTAISLCLQKVTDNIQGPTASEGLEKIFGSLCGNCAFNTITLFLSTKVRNLCSDLCYIRCIQTWKLLFFFK